MIDTGEQSPKPPSTKLLTFAIAVTILTIATIVLIFVFNITSTEYFIVPIVLTIISLITASLLVNWKDLLFLAGKLLHIISPGAQEKELPRSRASATTQQLVPESPKHGNLLGSLKSLVQRHLLIFMSILLAILILLAISILLYGYLNRTLPLIIVASASILTTVLELMLVLLLVEEKTRPISTDTISYPPPIKEGDVRVLRKEIVYTYAQDGKTMTQFKRLQIKALKDGITEYIDRYRWTGSGKIGVKSMTPGFRISRQFRVPGEIWNYFAVAFPKPLEVDEVVEFTIQWDLVDQNRIAIAFLSTMIERDTEYLSLEVSLPTPPKRAYYYEFESFIDTLPVETKEVFWNPKEKSIRCEVPNPQKYHKYLIRWHVNGSEATP